MPQRFFLIPLFLVAAAAAAQPNDALQAAQRLVVRSGLAEQLKSVPQQLDQELALARGTVPDPVLAALGEAAKDSFRPDTLQRDVMRTIAGRLTLEDMKQAIAWLETPVGRRVTHAEELATASLSPQALEAHADALANAPLSRKRGKLLGDLIVATKGVDSAANLTEGIALGIAMGVDSAQPEQRRRGLRALQAQLRQTMPPEQIREQIGAVMPKVYAYLYRDVSDADLAAYLRFNRSALGVRYNDTMMAAYTEAMLRASLRMGPTIEKALEKKPA